jgi:hypothetical protein
MVFGIWYLVKGRDRAVRQLLAFVAPAELQVLSNEEYQVPVTRYQVPNGARFAAPTPI